MRQGLEGYTGVIGIAKAATQVLPVAAHRQGRSADRADEVEREDLRVVVAAELPRHHSEPQRLARTRRPHNKCVRVLPALPYKTKTSLAPGATVHPRRLRGQFLSCSTTPPR